MLLPIPVDLLHQFLTVAGCRHRHLFFYLFVDIRVRFDVGAVDVYCFGFDIARLISLVQYLAEDIFHGFFAKAMAEIIAYGGKVWNLIIKRRP